MADGPASTLPAIAAMAVFVTVFALATLRAVHLGVLMFSAACAVGVGLANLPLREVVTGFPVGILVLVAGVTYFFGIAQVNGTTERIMRGVLSTFGTTGRTVPLLFFVLAGIAAAMGSPQAGLVTAPLGMPIARRAGSDPALMGIAINSGISAGAFAPTSLFGIVTYRIARQAGIDLNPLTLLAVAVAANVILLVVALGIFSGRRSEPTFPRPASAQTPPTTFSGAEPRATSAGDPFTLAQVFTMVGMGLIVLSIVGAAILDVEPDIGVVSLGLGAVLALIDPPRGAQAFARIDWSTAFVVGGIVTFVGVLQKLGAVDLLGRAALSIGAPIVAAFAVCLFAALVSAFASTTGVLAALVPIAVPLATSGGIAGWALITALGVSATLVDASPFSNTGATLVASASEDDRPRVRAVLLPWGLAMVVVGPLVLVPLLAILSR